MDPESSLQDVADLLYQIRRRSQSKVHSVQSIIDIIIKDQSDITSDFAQFGKLTKTFFGESAKSDSAQSIVQQLKKLCKSCEERF